MKVVARSSNGDIFLHAGQLAMADGKIAYAQIIEAAIRTIYGELQLDTTNGIPYFETIFESSRNIYSWEVSVKQRVMKFPFVTSIDSLETTVNYREHTLSYDMKVSTDIGTVTIKDVNYNIITHGGGGGGSMENLIQNGQFYLPVYIENSVQVYRKLTQHVDAEMGVTTELSETLYVKNGEGNFVVKA